MAKKTQPDLLRAVYAEMRRRAEEGCTGPHDGVCSDSEMGIHPKEWCNRCLMGVTVQAALGSTFTAETFEELKTKLDARTPGLSRVADALLDEMRRSE